MENLYLIKDLGALAGRDYRAKEIQNLQRIEQFALGLTTEFKLHQKAKTIQHFAEQIYYNGRSQAAVNKSLQSQINALVVAPRNNSANEIVQARVNVNGETFDTLKEHLDDWETKTQINKEETIRELNKTKQEILDIEYRFEPDKQEFLFVTELAPLIMSDTGGRVKPLPMRPDKLKNLGMLTEPGLYYLYTDHTVQIDDFPLPREWRDAGWFLEVKPPQTGGDVIQILTRNSYARNMMTFERVLSGRTGDISDWNYVPKNSGKWERVPSFITKMSDINIVGMSFYLTTDDTKRFTDFPTERKGVAGWNLYVEASNTGGFVHRLVRNSVTASAEILLKNYDSKTSSGPWTLHEGRIIS
ncbi:TPA: hypothetical protein OU892_002611 [Staphylococcus aureus]|nr:hypothetical protein [Staphylococcus aureus]